MSIDALEPRRLLAVVSVDAGKVVHIAGTDGNDSVSVALLGRAKLRISDGTATTDLSLRAVRRIVFVGGAGDDSITIGRVPKPCVLEGDAGNDSLSGGPVGDTISGGDGDDYLFGGAGGDELAGDNGADVMLGGAGNDGLNALSESATDDTIAGGEGSDEVNFGAYPHGVTVLVGRPDADPATIADAVYGDVEAVYGSPFNDTIAVYTGHAAVVSGYGGDDTLLTGSGADTIYGGLGRDSIVSGPGNDRIKAGDDNDDIDTVVGGSGRDYVYSDATDVLAAVEGRITYREGPEGEQIYEDPDGNLVPF